MKNIYSHQSFNKSKGIQRRKYNNRYQRRVNVLISTKIQDKFWNKDKTDMLESELQKGQHDRISPYLLAKKLLKYE